MEIYNKTFVNVSMIKEIKKIPFMVIKKKWLSIIFHILMLIILLIVEAYFLFVLILVISISKMIFFNIIFYKTLIKININSIIEYKFNEEFVDIEIKNDLFSEKTRIGYYKNSSLETNNFLIINNYILDKNCFSEEQSLKVVRTYLNKRKLKR